MGFSIEKTVAIKFEKRKRGEEPQLILHGSRVQIRESTCYLGLIILSRVTKGKSNPRLKGNRKGIIVKGKEFYIPILNTFPTR